MDINPTLWAVANAFLPWITVMFAFFVGFRAIFFRWEVYPTGRTLMWLAFWLLNVFVIFDLGFFVDATRPWYEMPEIDVWWRPIYRFLVFGGAAATITYLNVQMVAQYRWRRKHPDAPESAGPTWFTGPLRNS